jgi:DNA-binding GntR family transcriptional regulator
MTKQIKSRVSRPLKAIMPVRRPGSVRAVVYDALKGAIVEGVLPPGEWLIENQLSLQLGTSRTPVRDAIKMLESEGLVGKLHKSTFVLRSLTKVEVEETFGIRAVLESYAAYLVTEKMTDLLMRRLEETLQVYRDALGANDVERMMIASAQFHEMIYKASDSKKLYTLINDLRGTVARYRTTLLATREFAEMSLQDHVQMMNAMKEGDKEKVSELVRRHILCGKDIIIGEMEAGRLI